MGDETMMKFVSEIYLEDKQCSSENASTLEQKALQNAKLAKEKNIPDFKTKMVNSKEIFSSEDFKDGTYHVLIFWSTDCGHCKAMIPEIAQFMNEHSHINTVFVSLDTDMKNLKDFITKNPVLKEYNHVCEEQGWDGKLAKAFYIYATPTIFITNGTEIISKPIDINTYKKDILSLKNNN